MTTIPLLFFYDHAGFSYDPAIESKDRGHVKCALALAEAECEGKMAGLVFIWQVDTETDSSDFTDATPYRLWGCTCENKGKTLASLWAIDLGSDSNRDNPYRRVVEAELAVEALQAIKDTSP